MKHHHRSIVAAITVAGSVLALSACTSDAPAGSAEPTTTASSQNLSAVSNPEAAVTDTAEVAGSGVVAQLVAESTRPEVVVYKSATCGCCKDWVAYLEDEGFEVSTFDHDDLDSVKAEHGLTAPALKSCHTALVDGYVIEGHVPVGDIDRLLAERPDVAGLTAPGMPMNSPGMGSLVPRDYDVLAFKKDGSSRIFSSY